MTRNSWYGTRVLVTGARGFIASRLARRLVEAGARVYGSTTRVDAVQAAGLEWLAADLGNLSEVRRLLDRVRPDLVFHLAGHVTGAQDIGNVPSTLMLNLVSGVNLMTALAELRHGRLVLAGSMHETDGIAAGNVPCSPYAASKSACGLYARMFHELYGLRIAIARPMMVYGPGQWDVTKLLPYVTTSLLAGQPPRVGSGIRELDWVFVDDVVEGFLAVASAEHVDGLTIDLGSGTLTSVRAIVQRIARLVETDTPIQFGSIPDRTLERPRAANVDDTRRLIGWEARTSLDDGLAATVAWYRETWCSPKPA
jgi:nucleoside-diphosphate-sugar epimerase